MEEIGGLRQLTLKACTALSLSLICSAGAVGSQRSGMKSSGRWK